MHLYAEVYLLFLYQIFGLGKDLSFRQYNHMNGWVEDMKDLEFD